MPSRASYLLIIAGRLKGDPSTNSRIVSQINAEFADPPRAGAGEPAPPGAKLPYGAGWPEGFVLKDYKICVWSRDADAYGPKRDETLYTFRAEIHHSRPGSLYDNRIAMLPEVGWFYNYRDYRWHVDLIEKLRRVNEKIAKENKEKLIAPIWFCAYQWYCGNGGP